MIKQILNPGQIVQTGLAVDVDGIRVDYRKVPLRIRLMPQSIKSSALC